uniref:Uncharacterized protein n=1 Tax=Caenorhabditis japonica TaxID=281687 RepID=A0A8R1I5U9_CAEJA
MDQSDLVGIGNEKQIAVFGFSGAAFGDSVFNVYVEAWEEACKEEFKNLPKEFSDKDRLHLITLPFREPKIEQMFKALKRECVTNIFNIPESVTLPECKEMQLATVTEGASRSQSEVEKQLAANYENIRKLRIQIAEARAERAKMTEHIEVLQTLKEAQDQCGLIRENSVLEQKENFKIITEKEEEQTI